MTNRKTGNGKSTTTTKRKTTTAKKPAAKKAAAGSSSPKQAAKTTRTAKPRKSTAKAKTPKVTMEQRLQMIAEAAYYHSMNSDCSENEMEHWLIAESEIDARLTP